MGGATPLFELTAGTYLLIWTDSMGHGAVQLSTKPDMLHGPYWMITDGPRWTWWVWVVLETLKKKEKKVYKSVNQNPELWFLFFFYPLPLMHQPSIPTSPPPPLWINKQKTPIMINNVMISTLLCSCITYRRGGGLVCLGGGGKCNNLDSTQGGKIKKFWALLKGGGCIRVECIKIECILGVSFLLLYILKCLLLYVLKHL